MIRPGSQNARVLLALADGKQRTVAYIHGRAGAACRLNSRISELRRQGYEIEHTTRPGATEAHRHLYRLSPPLSPQEVARLRGQATVFGGGFVVSGETLAPRTDEERMRIYRLSGGELSIIATAEDDDSAGAAIVRLAREGEFERCALGLLDSLGDEDAEGDWVIKPWDAVIA